MNVLQRKGLGTEAFLANNNFRQAEDCIICCVTYAARACRHFCQSLA